jgi:hypothetical protein
LVQLLRDDEVRKSVERAIARLGEVAAPALIAHAQEADAPLRAAIVRALGRLAGAGEGPIPSFLVLKLKDPDPKTRRNAAIALGHFRFPGVEEALASAWEADPRPEMRRTIAATLGKIGAASALALLQSASQSDEPELARIATRAKLMVERTESRSTNSGARVDATRATAEPVAVVALSRAGLEGLLASELAETEGVAGVQVIGPGEVRLRLVGRLDALFGARTMVWFRFPLAPEPVHPGEAVHDAAARAVGSDLARRVFETWSCGTPRYRIAWVGGGHRRAATWDAARAISRRAPLLVNDPTASTWELSIGATTQVVEVSITPSALSDPRFEWRRGDVPAASHPTIAAALARVAGVEPADIVWDPFVGSGAELAERARLGPYRSLIGSDLDPRALGVARSNLDSVQVRARLEQADALLHNPQGVTLVITNPPMGRRASRERGLAGDLDRFVTHVAFVLRAGGRLVWIAPWPRRTRVVAERAGLRLDWSQVVDMGGFAAEMQRWTKPS